MNKAYFRFYEELNDFLPSGKKKVLFTYLFKQNPSVKDAIEALGVPHVEVDMILVNNISVDFCYILTDGDRVSVYPVFETLDISSVTHLAGRPLRETKFICDVHLGKLAKYLRLCGFDTLYYTELKDSDIVRLSVEEKRIIITRNRILLKNKDITHGYWIRSGSPEEQLKQVLSHFDLKRKLRTFSRCMECNAPLQDIEKKEIIDRLLPETRRYYRKFKLCNNCNRIYWNGSHFMKMREHIKKLLVDIG